MFFVTLAVIMAFYFAISNNRLHEIEDKIDKLAEDLREYIKLN